MRIDIYLTILFLLLLTGCGDSETKDAHWFEGANRMNEKREAYVESEMERGHSELEAKRAWDYDRMIGNTTGSYVPVESHGRELQEKLGP